GNSPSDGAWGRSRSERLLGPLEELSERGGTVDLARDEVLDVSESKEASRRRVLDDDEAVLAAYDEITPKLRLSGCYRCVQDSSNLRAGGRPEEPPSKREALPSGPRSLL